MRRRRAERRTASRHAATPEFAGGDARLPLPRKSPLPRAVRIYSVQSILYRVFWPEYMAAESKRAFSNPLALAILVLLFERPMHPYEMATTLRERHKESSIRLNFGALYAVIEQLRRENFIAVREVLKDGRRPVKTVYELRALGEAELIDWMRELVSSPVKEYPMFEAAISLLPVLPPEEVIELLEIRIGLLEKTIEEIDEEERKCRAMKLPRLFSLEGEYYRAITNAEYEFSTDLVDDLKRDSRKLRSGWAEMRKQLLAAKAEGRREQAPAAAISKKKKKKTTGS
jgi:DNA-binding PadR family transcriptional regulator